MNKSKQKLKDKVSSNVNNNPYCLLGSGTPVTSFATHKPHPPRHRNERKSVGGRAQISSLVPTSSSPRYGYLKGSETRIADVATVLECSTSRIESDGQRNSKVPELPSFSRQVIDGDRSRQHLLDDTLRDSNGFVYLEHRSESKDEWKLENNKRCKGKEIIRNPYDLRINLNGMPEYSSPYYTLSRNGVTLFGGDDVSFTTRQQFEREYSIFQNISQLEFFRMYPTFRALRKWRQNVRTRILKRRAQYLKKNLFLLHPLLQGSLVATKEYCCEIEQLSLYSMDSENPFTMDEFKSHQQTKNEQVALLLADYDNKMKSLVSQTCCSTLKHFLDSNGFTTGTTNKGNVVGAPSRSRNRALPEAMDTGPSLNTITYTERAAMRTQCRQLTKYIRLVDFFKVDAYLTLASSSTTNFLSGIRNRVRGDAEPLFVVQLDHDSVETHSSLSFTPNSDEFYQEMEDLVYDSLKTVSSLDRLLTCPELSLYVHPSDDEISGGGGGSGEPLDLEQTIVENDDFKLIVEEILDDIQDELNKAQERCHSFEPYAKQFHANEELLTTLHLTQYENESIDSFSQLVFSYIEQQASFESMPTTVDVGLIRVDALKLKELFVPSPKRCLMRIHSLLPEVLMSKLQSLLHDLSVESAAVSQTPQTVDEFTKLIKVQKTVQDRWDDYEARLHFVNQLNNICDNASVPISDDEKAGIFMLKQTYSTLEGTLENTQESINKSTERFATQLQESYPDLVERINDLSLELADHDTLLDPSADHDTILAALTSIRQTLDELKCDTKTYGMNYVMLLKETPESFPSLEKSQSKWKILHDLWTGVANWNELEHSIQEQCFTSLDVEQLSETTAKYFKVAMQAERAIPGNQVSPELKQRTIDFKDLLQVVSSLRCPKYKTRHWDAIHTLIGDWFDPHTTTLRQLVQNQTTDCKTQLHAVATQATQEDVLEGMMQKVNALWEVAEFKLTSYKGGKDVVLTSVEDVSTNLDESIVTVMTILGSRYVGPIRHDVDRLYHKLVLMQDTLEEWMTCQRTWMYLEAIFAAPDIQRQLPEESRDFGTIDGKFREHMKRVADDPNCLKCSTRTGLREFFRKQNDTLERIQKHLESYLDSKRQLFARFYFLSNDELLEILAHTKEPQAVQPHLHKCFDALVHLNFASDGATILEMVSPEGETVGLGKNLKARGNVEDWLASVENSMKASLQKLLKAGVTDYYNKPRTSWINDHIGQVVSTAAQVVWAAGTERAIRGDTIGGLEEWYKHSVQQLVDLTTLVRQKLSKRQHKVIVSLITTDVHARDLVEQLIEHQVSSTEEFRWQQQLRYYWDTNIDDCVVLQSSSRINYAYEYQGCTSRLVITPLTDRCWMTLTGALRLKLGGAPAGPAGTGKTESSKDLAKALGIQCIVYNCSDQIDYHIMGKLFSGLAQAGCWTCLDEFNRIDIEVLSVVAQQLLTLRQGRLMNATHVNFEGNNIQLKEHHVIITMNPGYAGRTPLPDNLKVLFRPVSMMVPDYALIAEIMLFAEGFTTAKPLSRKMTRMYTLCSQQLSQQCQYDYGLRAVKSVLVMAGGVMRANPSLNEETVIIQAMRDSNLPKFLEQDIPLFFGIIRDLFPHAKVPYKSTDRLKSAIVQQMDARNLQPEAAFLSKVIQLHETISVRFGSTVVGPAGSGKTTMYKLLQEAYCSLEGSPNVISTVLNPKSIPIEVLYGDIDQATQEWTDGLIPNLMRTAVQELEALPNDSEARWIVFDGPIDAIWIENMNTVLDDNMTLCLANGERIKLRQDMKCIFEVLDLNVASPATVSRVGVLYIPSDAIGWFPIVRTWLQGSMIKESSFPTSSEQYALHRIQSILPSLIEFSNSCDSPIPTNTSQLVTSFCRVFRAQWLQYKRFMDSKLHTSVGSGVEISKVANPNHKLDGTNKTSKDSNESPDTTESPMNNQIIDAFAVFSAIWSFGASLDQSYRDPFDVFLRQLLDDTGVARLINLPAKGLLYDYFVDICESDGSKIQFKSWNLIVPSFEYCPSLPFFQLVVPTPQMVCHMNITRMLLSTQSPVFLTGVSGAGKTVILRRLLEQAGNMNTTTHKSVEDETGGGTQRRDSSTIVVSNNNDNGNHASKLVPKTPQLLSSLHSMELEDWKPLPIFTAFSAQSSTIVTQGTLESKLEKKRRGVLGAPVGRSQVILCVDDVNMPQVEEYGAQPPIELLRQLLDWSGLYDTSRLTWTEIKDTTLAVAAAPPSGGRHPVTPRFVRHFSVICVPAAQDDDLLKIFNPLLSGFFAHGGTFPSAIRASSTAVAKSTVAIYNEIATIMRPSPAKTHYTFNLRDVSKVIQGILMILPVRCSTIESLSRLWVHECMRVFHDRLINHQDQVTFQDLVLKIANQHLAQSWSRSEYFDSNNFSVFVDCLGTHDYRRYEECKDPEVLTRVLNDHLDEYNTTNAQERMDLVLFRDALEHVARLCRVLRQPRGNAMLVGIGGSGKQSLSRLSAFVSDVECFTLHITKRYGIAEFREDLKVVLTQTGAANKPVMLLLTDSQISDPRFTEDVNNLLGSGEIPNLFSVEETDRFVNEMSEQSNGENQCGRDELLVQFVERVRANLHIILCFSPVGDNLRIKCRTFPNLINCCTIDWYLPWPKSALRSVATHFLSNVSSQLCEQLTQVCVYTHATVSAATEAFHTAHGRRTYTTPKSYLSLIQLFTCILQDKEQQLEYSRGRISNGVVKLDETAEMVEDLKVELSRMMPHLEQKSRETEDLLRQVAKERLDASLVQERVAHEEALVNEQAQEVSAVQADAQSDLDKAMPALDEAIKALDALEKKDITEMKSFSKPPQAVQTVMEAITLLLGENTDWETAKRILGDVHLLDRLKGFDKDHIPSAVLKRLKVYVQDPSMTVENVKKVSFAATSLCMWVHAMDVYAAVAKEVLPKRKRLEELNIALAAANEVLNEKQQALQKVEEHVAKLQAACDATSAEKERLVRDAEQTRVRLTRAEILTNGLESEGIRWNQTLADIQVQSHALVGDTFLAAAVVAYHGPFTGSFRGELLAKWKHEVARIGLAHSSKFSLTEVLCDPVQVREWQISGLPTDEVSTTSGILATTPEKYAVASWPLMIDPQMQANKWIRQREKRNNLEVAKPSQPNLTRMLEKAMTAGKPFLLENCEEVLDASLDPILSRSVAPSSTNGEASKSKKKSFAAVAGLITMGETEVEYHPNFRLYMTTKLPNPHFLPETVIKVNVINFTVTLEGLEEQLLGTVVSKERPDIEERRNRLVISMAADKKQLKDLEDKILLLLSESQGNILDDEELIETLAHSKTTSAIISRRVEESERTNLEVMETRNLYRNVARRGSLVYFVVADLASVDPMYQYSLAYYSKSFARCLDDGDKALPLEERLEYLTEQPLRVIFLNVSRGLFEEHKLLFAFLLAVKIARDAGNITGPEWALATRDTVPDIPLSSSPEPGDSLEDNHENSVGIISAGQGDQSKLWFGPQSLGALLRGVHQQQDIIMEWMSTFSTKSMETDVFSEITRSSNLSTFQLVVATKLLRFDRFVDIVARFVHHELGPSFQHPAAATIRDLYADMDELTPCILILSPGADPTNMLLRFAESQDMRDRMHVVSLGQGQGVKAESLIRRATRNGDWVVLHNCHLAKSWMPSLEAIVLDYQEPRSAANLGMLHPDFRLFLTSMPASYFPVSTLQNGVKFTSEPPNGIRSNLVRTYESILTPDIVNGDCDSEKQQKIKQLLYGLCFFHAIVQERRKFGALGWNVSYEFNDSDLETSVQQLLDLVGSSDSHIPWDALLYVTGEINYGGRITDDLDRRCLMATLRRFYNNDIFKEDFSFGCDSYIPPALNSSYDEYLTCIQSLPMYDDPVVFGLHSNADITFRSKAASSMLTAIGKTQPKVEAAEDGQSPDDLVLTMAHKYLELLPNELQSHVSTKGAGREGDISDTVQVPPITTFCLQEIEKYNKVLGMIRIHLDGLVNAINGYIVMSADLDLVYAAVFNNKVPALWSAVSYPSLRSLSPWFNDLQHRITFFDDWITNGTPRTFPMGYLYFPQGFLTSVLQTYSRKYKVEINCLAFEFEVCNQVPEVGDAETQMADSSNNNLELPNSSGEDSVVVTGLGLEGARWDNEYGLRDSEPGVMVSAMSPIRFCPRQNNSSSRNKQDFYCCPLYKTCSRSGTLSTTGMSSNFVVGVELPLSDHSSSDYWTWRAAALFCEWDQL